ncbi:MAG: PTS mannitol transporter subunit IICB [Chloroflexota bacterium]|nr:PTS mannitol transporter subunit IICB [Chloroflexota bacterium]
MTASALPYAGPAAGSGIQARLQQFGGFLAGMVMPNIGAFIAWGLITALFIPTGWLPNKTLAQLVGPMITFLLPILIGYTGGRLVYGDRGSVVGAIATVGVVVGASIPMFLGAMIVGPLAAWLLKQFDRATAERIPVGFEMLVGNFSLGILGAALAVLGLLAIGPVVEALSQFMASVVQGLVNAGLLPLSSIFIEPAKVLFLNNALNHGVLDTIGVQQSAATGKSLMFMLETNPGPGLGLLRAYWVFGPRSIRATTPGAIIIHFFGGIHEIYFPYVLMRPILIIAMIAGGMAGVATFVALGAGLVASPSPGSIFAELAMTPPGGQLATLAGIFVGTVVTFAVASVLLRATVREDETEADTASATAPSAAGSVTA